MEATTLHPLAIHDHFVYTDYLYRKLADGTCKAVNHVRGSQVVVIFGSLTLRATDIIWCLHYGNWPKYPLVQLDGDMWNLRMANIMPARLRRLRFRCVKTREGFSHPLAKVHFATAERCREDWADKARDFYVRDFPLVLEIEAKERDLRAMAGEDTFKRLPKFQRRKVLSNRPNPTQRPANIAGKVWHWLDGEWASVAPPCHPSDDFMVRIAQSKLGNRMIYDPVKEKCMPEPVPA